MKKIVVHLEVDLPEEEEPKQVLEEMRKEMREMCEDFGFIEEQLFLIISIKETA